MSTLSTVHRTEDGASPPRHHLVSLRVENKAGVLSRVAALFSRRGFNIFSLAVAPTDDDRFSRISIVVDAESAPLEQILDQIDKLVNVVEITELHPDKAQEAELLLATVRVEANDATALHQRVTSLGGSVVDEARGALTVMLAGRPDLLDGFAEELRRYGIVEVQRTGRIGLPTLGATT